MGQKSHKGGKGGKGGQRGIPTWAKIVILAFLTASTTGVGASHVAGQLAPAPTRVHVELRA